MGTATSEQGRRIKEAGNRIKFTLLTLVLAVLMDLQKMEQAAGEVP